MKLTLITRAMVFCLLAPLASFAATEGSRKAPKPVRALLITWSTSSCEDPGDEGMTVLMNPAKISAILRWKDAGFPYSRKMHDLADIGVGEGIAWAYINLLGIELSRTSFPGWVLLKAPFLTNFSTRC
ncbi:MAG: hypothetical protein A2X94_00165 [Bdellovibrionales bacterium GWB1_55_8]|nr:MAG: hypothetical protein A2X94_00165 [Bdellovibrionales bacterium GWB1_55_8]